MRTEFLLTMAAIVHRIHQPPGASPRFNLEPDASAFPLIVPDSLSMMKH